MSFLDFTGLTRLVSKINTELLTKQDKITGTEGQVVGFDSAGQAVAQENLSNIYSLEEQRIGTWIDGKPLYRRAFALTTKESLMTDYAIVPEYTDLIVDIYGV